MSLFKKPYIIAEIGSNFDQSFAKAKRIIKEAKNAGADAVKFQLFKSKLLYPDNNKMQKIFKKIELNKAWIQKLRDFSDKIDIHFFVA